MDCETCNDLLMDLLYDELDEVRAAAARKHLDGCASCRGAWQRLSQGRALASTLAPVTAPLPSATLLAAVESAARLNAERASDVPAAPKGEDRARGGGGDAAVAPVIPLEHAPRRVPTWLHRLGDLAMRREFAMAAVLLMAVGVTMRFLPWHTPGSVDNADPGTAPQVIPAQELPSVPTAAPAPEASALPAPRGRMMRSANAIRPLRAEPREQSAATEAHARGGAPVRVEEGDTVAQNAIPLHTTTRIAQRPASTGPADARYGSTAPPVADRFNAPSAVAAADRDLGRVLPAAPQPTVPAWRAAFNAGEDHRANNNREAAIASYRAALESDPPEAERTRIATALIGQLSRDGRVAEIEVVRARYLRPAPNAAAQVDEAQGQAPSTPHVPSSVPHPSMQRPARRAMPSATNIQAY